MRTRAHNIIPRHQSVKLAEMVGIKSQSYLSKILHGHLRPRWDLACEIDATGIVPFSLVERDYKAPKLPKKKRVPCKP